MNLKKYHEMVTRFNLDIIGIRVPDAPTLLPPHRQTFREGHLTEEMEELSQCYIDGDLEGVADGLLDLIYVALGTLLEMGIPPGAAFEEVHAANMRKIRGEKSTRPGSLGFDAIKPAGWTGPELKAYLDVTRADVQHLETLKAEADAYTGEADDLDFDANALSVHLPSTFDDMNQRMAGGPRMVGAERHSPFPSMLASNPNPKICVLGYGRHGKDTVCEMLREMYELRFTSSSLFCAEHVMMPKMRELGFKYGSAEQCYNDRHRDDNRRIWYETIRDFNRPDASALGRAILETNDVYCGLRSAAELWACQNSGIFDHIFWIDRSDHEPPESEDSCTVKPWMADYIIDNNGDLEDLRFNVIQLMNNRIMNR